MRNYILSCYLWVTEWRKMTEQTDWRGKQPFQRACVSEDYTLKCWGAWDIISHPPSPGGRRRRREYARWSSLKLRERAIISHRSVMLEVHRDRTDYWGRRAQDGHLDFHTAPGPCPQSDNSLDIYRVYGPLQNKTLLTSKLCLHLKWKVSPKPSSKPLWIRTSLTWSSQGDRTMTRLKSF